MIKNLFLASGGEWAEMFGTVGLLFGCIFAVIGIAVYISDKTNKTNKSKSGEDNSGCWSPIVIILGVLLFVAIMNASKCSCSFPKGGDDYYDSDKEYWENTPRHTD